MFPSACLIVFLVKKKSIPQLFCSRFSDLQVAVWVDSTPLWQKTFGDAAFSVAWYGGISTILK